jgi:hypothetical protein
MRYLLLLPFTMGVYAAPILGPPDGSGYQMMLSDFPAAPAKRMPTAGELAGLETALYDYFSAFPWFFSGQIHWKVQDSNSAGVIVGGAVGVAGSWATDFIYRDGVVSSSLIDIAILWDINEAGIAAGGAYGDIPYTCDTNVSGCGLTRFYDVPQTPDPRYPWAVPMMGYFTGIDEANNLWGTADGLPAYLHNGPVDFSEDFPDAQVPEPSTWLLATLGLSGLGAVRQLRRTAPKPETARASLKCKRIEPRPAGVRS